jgi:DNA-binding NarL/FixJ family response regulator
VADGATNAQIAIQLKLSIRTVGVYVSAILSKLGAQSRTEAVALARSRGLLSQARD